MEIDHIHPNPLPHLHHRKVELQSPLDLAYLRENIAAVARERLDLHFPPHAAARTASKTGGGAKQKEEQEDPMRARVATLVNQFLDRTFDFAAPSISINGIDIVNNNTPLANVNAAAATSSSIHLDLKSSNPLTSVNDVASAPSTAANATSSTSPTAQSTPNPSPNDEPEKEGIHFTYAPYDPRLSSQLASLYAELERETLAVGQLRRNAPAAGAKAYGEALMSRIEADIVGVQESQRAIGGANGIGELVDNGANDAALKLDPLPDGWQEDVSEVYDRGLRDLRRLGGAAGGGGRGLGAGNTLWSNAEGGGSLTETVGKVQRARDVAMELE